MAPAPYKAGARRHRRLGARCLPGPTTASWGFNPHATYTSAYAEFSCLEQRIRVFSLSDSFVLALAGFYLGHGCPSLSLGTPFVPPGFKLDSAGVVQIIEQQLLPARIRQVSLANLTARVHCVSPSPAATAPNNIPVQSCVNAVPARPAYISPNTSYEDDTLQPGTVNMIRYTPEDMSRLYASTGLAGRVTHVANVRGRLSDMGPPPPPAHAAPRGIVTATFDNSNKDPGYDDEYISQPAPPPAWRSRSRFRTSASRERSPSRARLLSLRPARHSLGNPVLDDHSRSVSRGRRSPVSPSPSAHSLASSRRSPSAARPMSSTPASTRGRSPALSPRKHGSLVSSPLTPAEDSSPVRGPPAMPPSPSPAADAVLTLQR
ncbi:hypothetical protein HDZ31DRAFT_67954 [Schizophyllum fasciatum]